MTKLAILLVLLLTCAATYAQENNLYNPRPFAKPKVKPDPFTRYKLLQAQPKVKLSTETDHSMPILKIELSKKFVGPANGEKDLYVIEPYNMPCISPSKNFKSNMPVALSKPVEIPKPSEE